MSDNSKFRWFFLAPIVVALLVVASPASAERTALPHPYLGDLEEFQTLVRLMPNNAEAHNHLGFAYKILGRYKEAIASYKEAIRIKPNYATAHEGLGDVYDELGQYKEAIASYKEALSINPNNTTVRNLLNNLEQKTANGIEKNIEND
jgi:tetratricopeptide (TPR) repeat protein